MELAFEFGSSVEILALGQPEPEPRISWMQARELGRRLMAEQAHAKGFAVWNETGLGYDASRAVYRYSVNSSRDVRDAGGGTAVIFDANTGALKHLIVPTGVHRGDTITQWLTSLHMAAVWGIPFRVFVSATGLWVALISVTGTVIWLRKRRARRAVLMRVIAHRSGGAAPRPPATAPSFRSSWRSTPTPPRCRPSDGP
jgi:uncharacterized iron-regulated membrane protein